jgi:peptidoglycan/LPS O-acetylase OafA/YrhL
MVCVDLCTDRGGRIASARAFSTENGIFDATYLQKVFLSLLLLSWFARRHASDDATPTPAFRIIGWFADRSFGIYFIHMYVVSYLAPPLLDRLPPLPANGWVPLLTAFVLYVPVALGLVVLAKQVSGRASRYLIGC